MMIEDVQWIRMYRSKMCPLLRSKIIKWYKPVRFTPCFLQKSVKPLSLRFKKIPVVVQTESVKDMGCSMATIAKSSGCKLRKDLALINSFSTTVSAKTLEKLVADNRVKKVWYDSEVRAILDTAIPTVGSSPLWDKDITGDGVVVAVLDTGVYDHPDLKGRIIGFVDFIQGKNTTYDDNGHGTHVAGAIASDGSSSDGKYRGPAPKSRIVGVKVLNKVGSGSLSGVIEGVQWCIENQHRFEIRIINLSLGTESYSSYKDDPLCAAVEKAWDAGLIVCAAAGNSGPNPRTINAPGIHPKIITVGAIDDNKTTTPTDDSVANFSSRGPTPDGYVKPDVMAPGVDIISLVSPRSLMDKQNKNGRIENWYVSMSGTSMACPICAGVIAQILQSNPRLTPNKVKSLLLYSCNPLDGVGENEQGTGVISVTNVLAMDRPDKKVKA
ncbi:S8 family peptidase [Alkalicella caledoniensis]|uniref:S8 family peptidase n=1 Tax=Alkalicella caledoniensis TaxID=2731377 RepID=A0A7G9W795_ALKCA|nr:S8 family peptidase [Alkalicella caledoniensis]